MSLPCSIFSPLLATMSLLDDPLSGNSYIDFHGTRQKYVVHSYASIPLWIGGRGQVLGILVISFSTVLYKSSGINIHLLKMLIK